MITAIKSWWKTVNMSASEKYLSEATDHVDLENRMKQLKYKGYWI
jgi:hypothetical protein